MLEAMTTVTSDAPFSSTMPEQPLTSPAHPAMHDKVYPHLLIHVVATVLLAAVMVCATWFFLGTWAHDSTPHVAHGEVAGREVSAPI
jgi:hypothetical protein